MGALLASLARGEFSVALFLDDTYTRASPTPLVGQWPIVTRCSNGALSLEALASAAGQQPPSRKVRNAALALSWLATPSGTGDGPYTTLLLAFRALAQVGAPTAAATLAHSLFGQLAIQVGSIMDARIAPFALDPSEVPGKVDLPNMQLVAADACTLTAGDRDRYLVRVLDAQRSFAKDTLIWSGACDASRVAKRGMQLSLFAKPTSDVAFWMVPMVPR